MTNLEKYSWLISTLRTYTALDLGEINAQWSRYIEYVRRRDDRENPQSKLDRQTMARWKKDIDTLFHVKIKCNYHNGYKYYIENPGCLNQDGLDMWILNSVSIGEILKNYKGLADRIVTDPIPEGSEFIGSILEAMESSEAVDLTMRNIVGSEYTCRIEPYALRQHKSVWHLLYKSSFCDSYMIVPVSRIVKVSRRNGDKFTLPKKFSSEQYFSKYFGVAIGGNEVKPCRIVLHTQGLMADYLKANPLHSTQDDKQVDGITEYTYYLVPTHDFIDAIIALGTSVKIISPESVVKQINDKITSLHRWYSTQNHWEMKQKPHKPLNGSFVAIDVDTANDNPSSICALSAIVMKGGELVRKYHTLIRPIPFKHSEYHTEINGISEKDTQKAPSFREAWEDIENDIKGLPFVGYNAPFDKRVLKAAFEANEMEWSDIEFINELKASRDALGYSLPTLQLQTVSGSLGSASSFSSRTPMAICEDIAAIALQIL